MEEQLISFETAKLAKEKGFIFKGNKIYLIHGDLHVNELISDKIFFQAPTQSLLQKSLVLTVYIRVCSLAAYCILQRAVAAGSAVRSLPQGH